MFRYPTVNQIMNEEFVFKIKALPQYTRFISKLNRYIYYIYSHKSIVKENHTVKILYSYRIWSKASSGYSKFLDTVNLNTLKQVMDKRCYLLTSFIIHLDISCCSSSFPSKFSSLWVRCLFVA